MRKTGRVNGMIGLAEKIEGIISELRNEGRMNVINKLLEKYSTDEVCKMLDIEKSELTAMIKQ